MTDPYALTAVLGEVMRPPPRKPNKPCGFTWVDAVHDVTHTCIDKYTHKTHHCACYWQGGGVKR